MCRMVPAIAQALAEPRVPRVLLRVSEAAEALACSRSTVYDLMKAGSLPTVLIGTEKRVAVAAIQSWVEQGGSRQ